MEDDTIRHVAHHCMVNPSLLCLHTRWGGRVYEMGPELTLIHIQHEHKAQHLLFQVVTCLHSRNVLLLLRHAHHAQHAAMTTPCTTKLAYLESACKHCAMLTFASASTFQKVPSPEAGQARAYSSAAQVVNIHMSAVTACNCLAKQHKCVAPHW